MIHMRGGSLRASVKLLFDDKVKHWLMTAYDMEIGPASGKTPALPELKSGTFPALPNN
jgi:hypothetical protein